MKFGYFDDAKREYVITTPRTPYPWINYLGTQGFFSLISNTAGGYSFYKDARLRRITRYRYNNVPIDMGGRYFYINDNGTIWNPGWSPVKTELDAYECRHGMGYTVITGKKNDLKAEVTFFVPQDYDGEVQQVVLTNEGSAPKTFSFFSFAEWCLWDAQDDSNNFQRNFSTGRVEIDGSVIYHKTEYRDRRDHFAFYSVNDTIDGYDTDRDSFIGLYNGFGDPQAVVAGKATDSFADGWAPIASHYKKITLAPGETKTLVFVLGYVEMPVAEKFEADGKTINKVKAKAMIDKYATPESLLPAWLSYVLTGISFLEFLRLTLPMTRLTAWLIFGTSISVWLPSTFLVLLPTSNPESVVEWVSVILTRTFWDLFIRFPTEQKNVLSILLPHSSPTVAAITSISLLPKREMPISVVTSPMILCG